MLISLSFKWQLTKVTISALPVPWIGYALSEDWPICLRSVFPIKWQGSSWPWATINQAYDLLSIISDKNRFFFPQAAWGSLARVNRKQSGVTSWAEGPCAVLHLSRALPLGKMRHSHGWQRSKFLPLPERRLWLPSSCLRNFYQSPELGLEARARRIKELGERTQIPGGGRKRLFGSRKFTTGRALEVRD